RPATQPRPDRGVPGAEALRGRDDVRRARRPLAGEPPTRSPAPGAHLVEADEEPVAVTAFGQALPEATRRRRRGQRRGADRLAEERRDGLGSRLFEGAGGLAGGARGRGGAA